MEDSCRRCGQHKPPPCAQADGQADTQKARHTDGQDGRDGKADRQDKTGQAGVANMNHLYGNSTEQVSTSHEQYITVYIYIYIHKYLSIRRRPSKRTSTELTPRLLVTHRPPHLHNSAQTTCYSHVVIICLHKFNQVLLHCKSTRRMINF